MVLKKLFIICCIMSICIGCCEMIYASESIYDFQEEQLDEKYQQDDYVYGNEDNVIFYKQEVNDSKVFAPSILSIKDRDYFLNNIQSSSYAVNTRNGIKHLYNLTRYSFKENSMDVNEKYVYSMDVTEGNSYLYDSDIDINGKMKLGKKVIVNMTVTYDDGRVVKRTLKEETESVKYLDFQKILYKMSEESISSLDVFIGGSGKVIIYGPYRVYSNTTIWSNYTGVNDNKYVTFVKRSKTPVTFINTNDTHSKNYMSSASAIEENDSYKAGRNISISKMYIDIDDNYPSSGVDATNVNIIKMIHASNIIISNCCFEANESYSFHNHVIELSAVKNCKIKNCSFVANTYNNISDTDMNNKYITNEAIQVESGKWTSNPFARFQDVFYTDTYNGSKYSDSFIHLLNKSDEVEVSGCKFINVPNCVGDHLGGKVHNYSKNINIVDCEFDRPKIAIHLRSLRNVLIQDCKINGNKIRGFSKYVTSDKKYESQNGMYQDSTVCEDIEFK